MVSPLQLITSEASIASTPQPSLLHVSDDKKSNLNPLGVPDTPSSSSTSHPVPSPASLRHSAVLHTHRQHRKANSLSSPSIPSPQSQSRAPASKTHTRSLSLQDSAGVPLVNLKDHGDLLASRRNASGEVKGGTRVMITPPENLPPSPPLTSHDTDSAEVDDEDSEDVAPSSSRIEGQEEDVTEAWHEGTSSEVRHSREIAPRHPLEEGSSPRDARVDIDLEKGPEQPMSQGRTPPSDEVDVPQQAGITKPFEIVRRTKRTDTPKPPHSSYYIGPPTGATAFSTAPCGQIGVHHPREIVRIERDYDHGELVQFSTTYPLELQGRITPTQFLETINALNEGLIRAHSLLGACIDNTLAILTLWISPLFIESKYEREMRRLQQLVDALNAELYNPQGLNILWPRKCAFLFLEIEYY